MHVLLIFRINGIDKSIQIDKKDFFTIEYTDNPPYIIAVLRYFL